MFLGVTVSKVVDKRFIDAIDNQSYNLMKIRYGLTTN